MTRRLMYGLLILSSLTLCTSKLAQADVAAYSLNAQTNPNTIVHYNFDGTTNAERIQDKANSNHLVTVTDGTGSAASILYGVANIDGSSSAVTPQRINDTNGAAFFTSNPINMPAAASFEAIIQMNAISGGNGYLAAARDNPNARNYFGVQFDDGSNDDFGAVAGNNFSNVADTITNYDVGDWYYVAVTKQFDGVNTNVDTWAANLSDGDTILSMIDSETLSGNFQNNIEFGIGLLNNSGTAQQVFDGNIDELTIYDQAFNQSFFQASLDRINAPAAVPEPASIAIWSLLSLGLAAFGVYRARRKR